MEERRIHWEVEGGGEEKDEKQRKLRTVSCFLKNQIIGPKLPHILH